MSTSAAFTLLIACDVLAFVVHLYLNQEATP